jgi:hypothetical protein
MNDLRYSLALLRAAFQGLGSGQSLIVTVTLPSGETAQGYVTGMGSRLGISTTDGRLVEDVRPEWVVSAGVQYRRK